MSKLSVLLEKIIQDNNIVGRQHIVHDPIVAGMTADQSNGYELQITQNGTVNVMEIIAGKKQAVKSFTQEQFVLWIKKLYPGSHEKIIANLKQNKNLLLALDGTPDITKSGDVDTDKNNK